MESDDISKFLKEYAPLKTSYAVYARAVRAELTKLLKKNSFKFQLVKCRGKSLESLRGKLEDPKRSFHLKKHGSIQELQDLAGCRVVFYIDSDLKRFVKHVYDAFDVVKGYDRNQPNTYNGVFLMVKPKKGSRFFKERKKFKDFICEIQLTTILHGAWAELGHDIVYKPPKDIAGFDQEASDALTKEFEKILNEHIKPAGLGFEYVYQQFNKIREGKKAFSIEFLKNIAAARSLTEIYQNLKVLNGYVREFGDKTPSEQNMIELAKSVIEKTKGLKEEPTITSFGKLRGSTREEAVLEIISILGLIRYSRPNEIFDLLIQVAKTESDNIKAAAIKNLGKLTEYNLKVLEKVNYGAQGFVLEAMRKWDDKELAANFDAVIEIVQQLLEPNFEGISWEGMTMTRRAGALNGTEMLQKIRAEALSILKRLFILSPEFKKRRRIIGTFRYSFQPPNYQSNPELDAIILENAEEVFTFYGQHLASMDNELIQDVDEHRNFIARRSATKDSEFVKKLDHLIQQNEQYQMFRIFVGYDGRLSPTFDFEGERIARSAKIDEYVKATTAESFSQWQNNIASVLKNYTSSPDQGEYRNIGVYFERLAEQKPSIGLRFLKKENLFEPFLLDLVVGIWKSKQKTAAKEVLRDWISQGKFLAIAASTFIVVKEIDMVLLRSILSAAKNAKNILALNKVIGAISENYERSKDKDALKEILLDTVSFLTTLKRSDWVHYIWYKKNSITAELNSAEADIILENLSLAPNIDYQVEEILLPIAEKFPGKIIGFFHRRVAIQSGKKRDEDKDCYDAVPYELHKLPESLRKAKGVIVPLLLSWYSNDAKDKGWLFNWEASHLLSSIFPALDPELEDAFAKAMDPKKPDDIDKAFSLLRNYEGQNFVWSFCAKLIEKYHAHPKYKEIQPQLWGYLAQTGVVSGEYGFAEAYEAKIKDSESWQTDGKKYLIEFIKGYQKHLRERADGARKEGDEKTFFREKGVFG